MKTRFGRMALAGLIFCPLLVGGAFTHPSASGPSETAPQKALLDAARKTYEMIVMRYHELLADVNYDQL